MNLKNKIMEFGERMARVEKNQGPEEPEYSETTLPFKGKNVRDKQEK